MRFKVSELREAIRQVLSEAKCRGCGDNNPYANADSGDGSFFCSTCRSRGEQDPRKPKASAADAEKDMPVGAWVEKLRAGLQNHGLHTGDFVDEFNGVYTFPVGFQGDDWTVYDALDELRTLFTDRWGKPTRSARDWYMWILRKRNLIVQIQFDHDHGPSVEVAEDHDADLGESRNRVTETADQALWDRKANRQLAKQGLRLGKPGEAGWYTKVKVNGEVVTVWATDLPAPRKGVSEMKLGLTSHSRGDMSMADINAMFADDDYEHDPSEDAIDDMVLGAFADEQSGETLVPDRRAGKRR